MEEFGHPATPPEPEEVTAWQLAARPFMTRTVVVLALFFFVASLGQLAFLSWELAHPPTIGAGSLLDGQICAARPGTPPLEPEICASLQRGRAMLLLEANIVERRYHQSNALMMFAVWSRYLGFVTGMILAVVGAAFILGKLAEPESRFGAAAPGGWKAEIRSTSPGLILCFLGVVLIVASIVTLHSLHTRDAATYILPLNPIDDGSPIVVPSDSPDDGSPIVAPAAPTTSNPTE